jgi:hypothetical protein
MINMSPSVSRESDKLASESDNVTDVAELDNELDKLKGTKLETGVDGRRMNITFEPALAIDRLDAKNPEGEGNARST